MTVITGLIKNAAGELATGTLTVKANKIFLHNGAVIDGNEYVTDVVDGVFTLPDIAPGPIKLVVHCGNWRKPFEKVLPDQASITFAALIESTIVYEPEVVSAAVQAAADAAGSAADAADTLAAVQAGAVPDSAVASKFSDPLSETRTVADGIYATPATVDAAVAPKLDQSQVDARVTAVGNATYAPASQVIPTMGGLVRALKAGQSAAISVFGDSTGDSDGSVAANDRLPTRFLRRLATAFPSHHVMTKLWNPTTEAFGPWVAVQNHASGRRYAAITTRSLRYVPPVPAEAKFASGNIDVRALISPDSLTPATPQSLIAKTRKGGSAGPWTNDLQFDFRWYTDGKLSIRHSQDGAAFLSDRVSTVAVPVAAGAQIWVRATVEIVPGTGFTAKFYTSSDGATWTQLGANVTGGGATTTALYAGVDDSFFEVGGFGWQPVSNAFGGKIYEVQVRDGVDGHTITPSGVEVWERYGDAATSFGGAPTLYMLNASRSGSAMTYHTDPTRLRKETPNYGQVALLFNDSHNEATATGSLWIPPYEAWVTAIKGRLPSAAVNVVGQNPHTSAWVNEAAYGQEHVKRIMELSAAAARLGWGFVNVFQAYLDDPRGVAALVSADGLHPVADGYALSGDTVAKAAGIV